MAPTDSGATCTNATDGATTQAPSQSGPNDWIPGWTTARDWLSGVLGQSGPATSSNNGGQITCADNQKPFSWGSTVADAAHQLSNAPAPAISDAGTDQATGVTAWLGSETVWLTLVVMTVSIAFAGTKIAWDQGRRGSFHLEGLLATLVGWLVASAGFAGAIGLLTAALNAMGGKILDDAAGGNFQSTFDTIFNNVPMGVGDIPAMGVGGLVWLAMWLQVGILTAIGIFLPIMVGLYPLTYAVTSLTNPLAWRNALTGLILAAAAYRFVVDCIYGAIFEGITASGQTDGPSAWAAVIGLLVAVWSFHTIYKVLSPVAAPFVGASLGGVATATTYAAMRVH